MKNNILLKLNVCACAVLLAACGGSGGGSSSAPSSQPANTSTQTQNQNTGGTIQNSANGSKLLGEFGGVVSKTIETNNGFSEFATTSSNVKSNSLNNIVVNGKSVDLVPAGLSGRWIVTSDSQAERQVYTGLSYTRFGLYTDKSQSQSGTYDINLFAHGQLTEASKVPTTGTATYMGYAIYADDKTSDMDALKLQNGWARGDAKFDVNYGEKTISGQISSPEKHFNAVDLKGTIAGNGFNGTHNDVQMSGHFFGANAEELGGTFHKGTKDKPDFLGAFGAKKQ